MRYDGSVRGCVAFSVVAALVACGGCDGDSSDGDAPVDDAGSHGGGGDAAADGGLDADAAHGSIQLDPTFGTGGLLTSSTLRPIPDESPRAVMRTPGGNLIVVGTFHQRAAAWEQLI